MPREWIESGRSSAARRRCWLQRATCRNLSKRGSDHEPCTLAAGRRPTCTSIQGASAPSPEPRRCPMKWEPSDPTRWAVLGLADPPADGAFPDAGLTADLLAYALTAPGAEDPIAGIVDAVRVELIALGDALRETEANIGDALHLLARRLETAVVLLDRCDGRIRTPKEPDPDAEVTQDAAPEPEEGGSHE